MSTIVKHSAQKHISGQSLQLLEAAKKNGAIHADAVAICDTGDSISIRNGIVESVEREDAQGIGLRAFVETPKGLAFATASTSDVSESGLSKLAEQVISMARISEPDPDAVPPVGANHPSANEMQVWADEHDRTDCGWNLEQAKSAALECEDIARNYSDLISNSEGADASFGGSRVAYASSDGFIAEYAKASASLSVSVIAGTGEHMQRDYAWHRAFSALDLHSPQQIAEEAASRACRRLNPSPIEGGETTVIFEPRIAASLLGHLIGAINGRAVLQQRSFLAESLNQKIFPDFVRIEDNPNHPDGLGNRLFDGEGTRCSRNRIISNGCLNTFLADRYVAKRLGQQATGNASRGLTGDIGIGSSNLIWQPGAQTQAEMISAIGNGVLITELIGFGVNGVTGDYSRGAGGFLIENGMISHPVQGITIAGNLKNMFANIEMIGSDLTWLGSSAVPSIAISGMTVAGE
ncbi:TldD/PmbA family protein [Mariprofundus sp. EBB-1]|uniref:TldD/PmbA family protein n=1 Tax=Mariprofundus sp. EBB-1 TaxID=2650971 RepID=UPI000EF1C23C|nr:TldD/PmbA family protein [Mariprofundus sp. EBB-1]RLL53694.1 TldD/PmbA family protein [Mariprofundus sp. EBB-1]